MSVSGKVVIIGILAVALIAAGTSWWFRYSATHRAVEFWGPNDARLIRDAPQVELLRLTPGDEASPSGDAIKLRGETYDVLFRADVSQAKGLTHLRHALLEERSFEAFGVQREPDRHHWRWALKFHGPQGAATVLFAEDCTATALHGSGAVASCDPIAAGLRRMFAELASQQQAAAR